MRHILHKRLATILISAVLILSGTAAAWSTPYTNSRSYTVDNGLSSNCVYGIVQDAMGFIWFGTKNGLCRFDSREFRCYYHSGRDRSSISSNNIRRLAIDSRGWIWISLDYGVDIYDPHTDCFRHLDVVTKEGVGINDQTIEIIEDNDGEMWISTVDSGLFRYSPEDNRLWVYTHDPADEGSISQNYISTLYKSRDGVIWAGTYSEGLCSFSKEEGTFTRYKKTSGRNSISDNSINTICEDSYGNLWLGMVNTGIDRFDRAKGVFTNFNDRGAGNRMFHMHSMAEIAPGELLVCSDSGASLFQITETGLGFNRGTNPNFSSTRINYVFSFLKDREGNLWFGSTNDGVEFYPAYNNFTCYPTRPEENTDLGKAVNSVCEYRDDTYWIGTYNNGIMLYDGRLGTVTPYRTARDVKAAYNVFSMLMDEGKLWVATYQRGVEVIDPATKRVRSYLSDGTQPYSRIFSLLRSSTGRIYAGTAVGLYYYNRAADDFEKTNIKLDSRILDLAEDQSGRLWAATAENGLHMYDPKTGVHKPYLYDRDDDTSISRNTTVSVAVDRFNRVWVGTSGYGICRYNEATDSFVRYDDLALPNGIVSNIIPDGDYLWIATEKGLSIFNPDTNAIKTYSASDGIHNEQFRANAGIRTSGGKIILGTGDGICTFAPRDIVENKYAPPVVITNLSINNHTVRPDAKNSPIDIPIERTERITLSHRQSFIGLRFASLSYISPDNNQYRYRLDGLDKEWHVADGANTTVSYNNLRPGEYLFRVQGSNCDMVWSPVETTLAIRIKPPLLQSKAAQVIYAILSVILLILLIHYLLKQSDKKHREKMTQLETEKERELYDTRLDFFTNIAHEIRTPLSLIIGPLEYVMKSRNIADKYGDYLSVIEQNYKRLYNLVGQLLDFRKVDSGSYTIKYGECDVAALARELAAMFEPTILQKNMRLVADIDEDNMTVVTDQEALTKIVSNLLANAIKYAEKEIRLRVWRKEDGIGIEVTDDGPGIPAEERGKVFDAFYQIKSDKTAAGKGVGIGLHMTRTFIRLMGGEISVEDREDGLSGSVFSAYIAQPDPASVAMLPNEKQLKEYIAEDPDRSPGSADEDDEEEEEDTPAVGRQATIMIIDDNAEILDFLAKVLSHDWFVISATSAEEALKLLQNNDPDLIVSDIMMDGMDGVELCRRIKNDIRTSHIPTVLLTAKTDVGTKIESLECGADAYIEKPFSPDHLKAQLRNLLRKRDEIRRNYTSVPMTEIRTTAHNRLDEEFIEKCREVIIENMSNPDLSVDLLARELAVSRTSIFKKLKAITDMTPNDFMKLVRLKEACRMMIEGEYRITEIGFITGFSSSSYFAKCFLKQFGILPTEFVKNLETSEEKDNSKN